MTPISSGRRAGWLAGWRSNSFWIWSSAGDANLICFNKTRWTTGSSWGELKESLQRHRKRGRCLGVYFICSHFLALSFSPLSPFLFASINRLTLFCCCCCRCSQQNLPGRDSAFGPSRWLSRQTKMWKTFCFYIKHICSSNEAKNMKKSSGKCPQMLSFFLASDFDRVI